MMKIEVTQVELTDDNGNQMKLSIGDVVNITRDDGMVLMNKIVRGYSGLWVQIEDVLSGESNYLYMNQIEEVERVL